jgi:hypothetical protein
MHYLLLIYFNNNPLPVLSSLAAHRQENQLCINSSWNSHQSRSSQQPVKVTLDYTTTCLHRVDPPDDEQQGCLKHIEDYYYNKLIENSASCWFMLYGYTNELLSTIFEDRN